LLLYNNESGCLERIGKEFFLGIQQNSAGVGPPDSILENNNTSYPADVSLTMKQEKILENVLAEVEVQFSAKTSTERKNRTTKELRVRALNHDGIEANYLQARKIISAKNKGEYIQCIVTFKFNAHEGRN
jgi:tRNA splicing endonuclease